MILIILKEGKWLSGPHVGKNSDDTEASNKKNIKQRYRANRSDLSFLASEIHDAWVRSTGSCQIYSHELFLACVLNKIGGI